MSSLYLITIIVLVVVVVEIKIERLMKQEKNKQENCI